MGAVGSYTRFLPNAADQDEFNINLNRAHDGLGPVTPRATAEQIKQLVEEAQAADETRTVNGQNSDEFVSLHPEFLDHRNNCEQFNKTLDAMFGANRAYTLEMFEQAYRVCLANNSLELDQVEIVKQAQAEANTKRKAAQANRLFEAKRQFNPDEDYSNLSLEEIRQRAEAGAQQDLERRAYQEGLR